jgi:hypothetical protein
LDASEGFPGVGLGSFGDGFSTGRPSKGSASHDGRPSTMKSTVLESSTRLPLEVRNDTARASLPGIRARSTRSSGAESDWSNGGQDQMMRAG